MEIKFFQKTEVKFLLASFAVLILCTFLLFYFTVPPEKPLPEFEKEVAVLSMVGEVLEVNSQNNYLIVKNLEEEEIKVNLSQDTRIVRIEPTEFKEISIAIDQIEIGRTVLIETTKDIRGKTEFNGVGLIQVLP